MRLFKRKWMRAYTRIIFVGFSQGGAVALYAGVRSKQRLAGTAVDLLGRRTRFQVDTGVLLRLTVEILRTLDPVVPMYWRASA